MLSDCTVLANSKETVLRSSNQDASSPEDKNVRVVIKLWRTWKSVHSAIFSGVDIPKVTFFYDSYILIKGLGVIFL